MKQLYKKIAFGAIFLFTVINLNAQTIRYVKQGGTGNGTSWVLASGDFQAMINASSANDQVWVAAGIYQPQSGQSFSMKEGVKILGGFPSTGSPIISNRNWAINTTTLQGNAFRVITNSFSQASPMTNQSVLDGFIIKGGNILNSPSEGGAGMYNYFASPLIINCIFSDNINNSEYTGGGAIFNYNYSSPVIVNNVFYNNSATGTSHIGGGAVYNYYYSSPNIINSTLYGNNSNSVDAVITNYHYCSPNISNTLIIGNSSGIFNFGSGNAPVYKNSVVQGIGADATNGNLDGNTITPSQIFTSTTSTDAGFLRLTNTSPAKNAGNNTLYSNVYGEKDLGFLERKYSTIDMGAYENQVLQLTPDTNNILYVDKNATGTGSGSSWTNAITKLAHALKWAKQNESTSWATTPLQIWVAGGTYKPMYSPEDGANFGIDQGRDNAFLMVNNVQLYGGFAGTETTLAARDLSITANASILSGDVNGDDVVTGSGSTLSITNNGENNYHVLISANAVGSAGIDGFTIKSGNADASGILTINSQTINRDYGGGMSNYSSSPTITNVQFTANNTYSGGSGVLNSNSSPTISNVSVTMNSAAVNGGGMLNFYSSPTISNALFSGNSASTNGGGMHNDNSSLTITNAQFTGNNATDGGGIYNNSGNGKLLNTTLVGNTPNEIFAGGSTTWENTIVWGTIDGTSYTKTNCLIQGNTSTADGNIDATGLTAADIFTNPVTGDYSLKNTSPAVNTGSNTLYTDAGGDLANDVDLAGNPRLYDGTPSADMIDMGAYELQENSTLGYDNFEVQNTFIVYPNPSNGIYTIESQDTISIEVYDLVGKQIMNQNITVGISTLDISKYANGIYLAKVTSKNGSAKTLKLIKN